MVDQIERTRSDIFGWPVIGFLFKNRKALVTLQIITIGLFFYAIIWGLVIPEKPDNLFTTGLFWGIFWPFFMLTSLSTFGAVFCTVCPHGFLGKYITKMGLKKKMPKSLQNPYIGLSLLIGAYWIVFYTYEPMYKGPFAVALFFLLFTLLAFVTFFLFEGMSYCKNICPLGAFTNAFSKVSFTWLSTEKKECDSCKSFECAKSCPYKLSPFNFDKNGSMADCTLCMECAHACEAVTFKVKKPSFSLMGVIKKMREIDIWVYVLMVGIISITMRFHHALGRSAIADQLPWYAQAAWLENAFPSIGITLGGLMALLYAVVLTLLVSIGGFYIASKILKTSYKETFVTLGYALAPLMLIGALSHVGSFFFTSYYHNAVNGFIQAFYLPFEQVAPLARFGESWLRVFGLFNYLAAIWSFFLFYKRMKLMDATTGQKIAAYPFASALVIFYLAVGFFVTFVFATYGVGGHGH